MGIAVFFIAMLVGLLLGLAVGLLILSAVQRHGENKRYKRTMQEAMGFEDDVKKIQRKREKEENRKRKVETRKAEKEERRLQREQERADRRAEREIDRELEEEEEDERDEIPTYKPPKRKRSDSSRKKSKESGGGGILDARITEHESFSDMQCDGEDEDKNEIIRKKRKTQDDKYNINKKESVSA